ncbi:MAG: sporulation protein YqfC [Clostridium sp.]|uniref:sporulation protein YqfC n=1 Tax=Clostridium sp. TaxID=1506 RepID=UPI003039D399
MSDKLLKARERVVYGLELPVDVALNLPQITILADKEITVENHKGIVKFDSDELVIKTSLGLLKVLGRDFEIIFVGGTTIILRGKFNSVVYNDYDEDK